MGVTGIGSSSTYIYNVKTGKLASKAGSKSEFVDFFNGDITREQAKTLNGYDAKNVRDIKNMIMVYQTMGNKNVKGLFQEQNGDEYEITSDFVDAVTTQFSVNGEKVFKAYDMNVYTFVDFVPSDELLYKLHSMVPGAASGGMAENSICFGAGASFALGNGYSLEIRESSVSVNGLGSGSLEQDNKAKQLAYGLDCLLRFAGKQKGPEQIDMESTPMILSLLRELGIDTDRTFQINGTRCEVRNGRIVEAGRHFGVPDSVFQEALKKYEDVLSMPLQ